MKNKAGNFVCNSGGNVLTLAHVLRCLNKGCDCSVKQASKVSSVEFNTECRVVTEAAGLFLHDNCHLRHIKGSLIIENVQTYTLHTNYAKL